MPITSVSASGVLVFDTTAHLRHVDTTAVSLLNENRQRLFDGTADVLNQSLSTDQGQTFSSVQSLVEFLLTETDSPQAFSLSERLTAEARVSYGPEGPNGVVVTVKLNDNASAEDTTEGRRTDATLRGNRDLLQRTQKLAHVGGWTYDPETDKMEGTDETYRICEIPLEEELTLDDALSLFPSDTAAHLANAVERCLRTGEPFHEEGPLTTPEDTRRWVRVRGEVRQADADGKKLVGTVQDLTERHEMEERLREQKNWLRSITDNISGGIYRSTSKGLVYANQALLDLFGYDSLEEMAGENPRTFYVDPQVRSDLLQREQEQGGLNGVEVEYCRKDGSTFVGLLRSTKVHEEDGETEYFDGVVTDITEEKVRERTLREQREKTKAVYGRSDHLLRAERRDEVGAVLVDLVYETFGYAGAVLRIADGRELVPIEQSPPLTNGATAPQSHSVDGSSFVAQIYRDGTPNVLEDVPGPDHSLHPERPRAMAGIPLGQHGVLTLASFESPTIDEFDLHLIEILTQKATAVLTRLEQEEMLRASKARFRGLFEEAALGIALLDRKGRIIEANSELASMLGYAPEPLRGRHFGSLTHPEDGTNDQDLFDELVDRQRDRYELEKQYVKKDGSRFWAHVTVSRHRGPGEATVIGMVKDISSRKRYEEQLKEAKQTAEEASRLKSTLLANMSHELRTPLTSIIGFTGILRDNLSDQNARYAKLAHKGGERLMDTLDDVFQLSKLEAGVTEPASEPMDLVSVARQTVHLYETQADTNHISLHFAPHTDELPGRWPPKAIQHVLSNLLSNAVKFTPEGGRVTVRVRTTPDVAVLEVEDTGVGISSDFRPQLFDAFTQESKGLTREHEGIGLGLAITKQFVSLLDGDIDVESRKGEGTRFTIRLPHKPASV